MDYTILLRAVALIPPPTVVLSGMAQGADNLGIKWAHQMNIPLESYPAQWRDRNGYDRRAGLKRNTVMAEKCDQVLALWDGRSNGTRHMISEGVRLSRAVYVWRIDYP